MKTLRNIPEYFIARFDEEYIVVQIHSRSEYEISIAHRGNSMDCLFSFFLVSHYLWR